jgi:hypothetical protein
MICPVEIAGDMSALRAARVGDHAGLGILHEGRDGAAMKVQEVILRAAAKKISWWQAAEIIARAVERFYGRRNDFGETRI